MLVNGMRVVSKISTPWAPYSVMFSNDGTRLAIGGGSWYGEGGLMVCALATGTSWGTANRDVLAAQGEPRDVTTAGVYFSADDRYLVVATRGSSLSYAPSHLLAVDGLRLARRASFVQRHVDTLRAPFATGVLLSGESVVTRHNGAMLADCIDVHATPPGLGCRADDRRQHLTHSRMVVRRGRVLTGGGGSLALAEWRADLGTRESGKLAEGLVSAPLAGDAAIDVVPVDGCKRVTAIAALADEDGFLTGGLMGELDRWSAADGAARVRLEVPRAELEAASGPFVQPPRVPGWLGDRIVFATYTPRSVVAICTLCDGARWVSVDAGGRLRLWGGDALVGAWTLPVPGSPRSLAAHPTEPWIGVGIKEGGFGAPASTVLVLEL
jgi:hypothetical protein